MTRRVWPAAAGAVAASAALVSLNIGTPVSAPLLPPAVTWAADASPQTAAARPLRVRIPAIGVDSELVELTVDAAGALVPPESAAVVGWFADGPAPGGPGPALLAGHVDSQAGPGAFYRLRELGTGDIVEVGRADGTAVRFAVVSVIRAPKAAFPTDLVYAPTPAPELRLVTCGGVFDRSARSYRDNVIVEAVLSR